MKWELTDAVLGDMIRVKSGSIYHYGIFVNENEIIQFGLPPIARQNVKDSDISVCASDIETFLQGGFLEVAVLDKKEARSRKKPSETVRYAKSCIGVKGYNILYNNCEHFAYQCVFGKKKCTQTDDVREMFRNMFKNLPTVEVYTASIPQGEITDEMLNGLYPQARRDDISACSNQQLKRQKYYAWKLLEYALHHSFGYNMAKLTVEKNGNGKWISPSCFFSVSHSENAVAVAVSKQSVGVDIQNVYTLNSLSSFCKKTLTDSETAEFDTVPQQDRNIYLLTKWAEKESIFKSLDQSHFKPSKLTVADHSVNSREVTLGGNRFVLAVTNPHIDRLKYYPDIDLLVNKNV